MQFINKNSGAGAAILGVLLLLAALPVRGATFTPIRVAAGSSGTYTDSQGNRWSADTGYTGGTAYNCECTITGTKDPTLYQGQRWGAFSYSFAAPSGSYAVTLMFAEGFTAAGQREFNVAINGTTVLSNFDIFVAAGGTNIAVDKTFNVTSTGTISINFTQGAENYPKIDAIQIVAAPPAITTQPANQTVTAGSTATFSVVASGGSLSYQWMQNGSAVSGATSSSYTTPATTTSISGAKFSVTVSNSSGSVTSSAATLTVNSAVSSTPAFTPIRVAAGAGSKYTDSQGNVWSADSGFSGGNAYNCECTITGTKDPTLYQGQRWGTFSYSFAAPSGSYAVTLKFAEAFTAAGDREFNVAINGTTVLSNFDIFVAAGGTNIAVDKTFNVTSTGTISINFTQGAENYPKIDAIQVVSASSSNAGGSSTSTSSSSSSSGSSTSGSSASLSLSSGSLSFGNVAVSGSTSEKVTLTNNATASVTISNVSISGAGFSASGISSGQILTAGQAATLTVTFGPSASGSSTGSVSIASNAPTKTVSLSGTGVTTTHSVTVSWTPSASSSISGYNVYASTSSGGPYTKLTSAPVASTTYTDNGLQADVTYYFVITSVNSSGVESADSKQASATTP